MTIHQLRDRCWELQPPTDDERQPHYDTEAGALEALKEDRAGDEGSYPDSKPVRLGSPCWLVQCDGECEVVLDTEGESYAYHHGSHAEAEETARAHDWTLTTGPISGDELVYCDEDRPEDVSLLPPAPAELEAAGQLRLPGVA